MVYTYNRILLGHRKEWNLAICDTMGGPWGHCAKWNKSDRERQILYDLIYTWTLKSKTKQNTKLTDREKRLVVARGVGVGGGRGK